MSGTFWTEASAITVRLQTEKAPRYVRGAFSAVMLFSIYLMAKKLPSFTDMRTL